jgi:small subunit ribosomal protein S8
MKQNVAIPASKEKEAILKVLQAEGYIRSFHRVDVRHNIENLIVELKYVDSKPAIVSMKRISTPGRRVYTQISALKPIANGLGINILSTSSGIMSDVQAKSLNVGGEVLCSIF